MKKRRLAYWLCLLPRGGVWLGAFLFALQFLMLGLIHHGPHGEVRERPYFVPRRIEDAAAVGDRMYILYHDSGAVNVYDGEGNFQWAISIPWHDHSPDVRIRVKEDSLFLYQEDYDVYQFDRETGALLTSFPREGREEEFPDEPSSGEVRKKTEWEPGKRIYDDLSVYRVEEDGRLTPLVYRSGGLRILYFGSAWLIAFSGMIGVLAVEPLKRKLENKGTAS